MLMPEDNKSAGMNESEAIVFQYHFHYTVKNSEQTGVHKNSAFMRYKNLKEHLFILITILSSLIIFFHFCHRACEVSPNVSIFESSPNCS